MKKILLSLCLSILFLGAHVAEASEKMNPDLLCRAWDARWITHPEITGEESGVYLFRKTLVLKTVPNDFLIHVSADNRYKLYVNGAMVSYGPSRGDSFKWRFESIDIARFLKPGTNTICAIVWNFAEFRPIAHASVKTGLIVQGDTKKEHQVNTGGGWKVMQDTAYTFHAIKHLQSFYAVGPGEAFDANKHPWNWMAPQMDDSDWPNAKAEDKGQMAASIKATGNLPARTLFPRQIPMMEMTEQSFATLRSSTGIDNADAILQDEQDVVIKPQSKVTLLLDQGQLTTAYPVIRFSHGKGAEIKLIYAESLYHQGKITTKRSDVNGPHNKGNRNVIKDKIVKGNYDIIVADGGAKRLVEPLWWRTFRYVQIEIATQDEALTLHELNSIFTGYPLEEKATFKSDLSLLTDIWNVGWHTQRMCAGENFYDCPYYEQLQYVGDTRIQGLITYYVSGDTALWKKSIECFYDSRLPFGLTQSRYPSSKTQVIPTFSLIWITMCHDYFMHCNDPELIKPMLPAITDVLQWFEQRMDDNGLPGDLPYWIFVDWVNDDHWKTGVPPTDAKGHSAIVALQYVYTLDRAAALYQYYGQTDIAEYYQNLAAKTKQSVLNTCWDEGKKMIADTPTKKQFSQHANIWAVLVDLLPPDQQKDLLERTITDGDIAQSTYYFRFYLAEALKKVGMADRYTSMLGPWEEMLDLGLSTFAEKPDPTRSDCHAWSASPNYHLLSLVCGIEPTTPGFKTVRIAPALGGLTSIDVRMPHPKGEIKMILNKTEQMTIEGEIVLPPGLHGVFELQQNKIELKPGTTRVVIPSEK